MSDSEFALQKQVRRYKAQSVLFSPRPKRLAIQQLEFDTVDVKHFRVNVWRNHAFEPLVNLVSTYLRFGGISVVFNCSDYDDSLSFGNYSTADVELIWLDADRYQLESDFTSWLDWLRDRLYALRERSEAIFIIAICLSNGAEKIAFQSLIDSFPGVHFADLMGASEEEKFKLFDPRTAAISGTVLSSAAQVMLARRLGCHWLPAAILPPIKAVALDLDNTLHSGILGEEGIDGVELTPAHARLQSYLRALQVEGIFVTLISRNDLRDVESLFERRTDYPLAWSDFSAAEVSWEEKSTSIVRIADTLRIGIDATLFIDDNIGELLSMNLRRPEAKTIHAHEDADITLCTIKHYPGLWRWNREKDNLVRVADLKASAERARLLSSNEAVSEYFHSLGVTLAYANDSMPEISRMAELCGKTNQFNLALRRLGEFELSKFIISPDSNITSVHLKDRLSDSGLIAVIAARKLGRQLCIEELCLSCRSLGRKLETEIIVGAIVGMPIFVDCSEVLFAVKLGPRNEPAITWLENFSPVGESTDDERFRVPAAFFAEYVPASGIRIIRS